MKFSNQGAAILVLLVAVMSGSVIAADTDVPLMLKDAQVSSLGNMEQEQPVAAHYLELLGCILEPSVKVHVSSPVPGVISDVRVRRGDHVKKGDVLFGLRDGVQAAGVELARVKARFAERKKERNKDLFQGDLLSPYERDEIETEMRIAQSELALKEAELALRIAYSPFSGVITERHFGAGEYVSVDPVISLAALDPLHVDMLLPASYFGRVKQGEILIVHPEAPVNGEYETKVSIVDPLVDPASGTFRVQLVLPNPSVKLPAGVRCSASRP